MADNHFKVNRGLSLVPQASAPLNPVDGDVYYDSTLLKFRKYEGGQWSNFSGGSGSGSGTGDDLNSLSYRVSTYETFDLPAAQLTNINMGAGFSNAAGLDSVNQYWKLNYDANKTVTTSGTGATLSATPAFTVTPGCVLISGQVQRKIITVTSQTVYVLEAAFPTNLSAAAACVSETVHTVDLNNYAGDGLAPSAAISTTIGSAMIDYEDTTTSGDIILDIGVTPHIAFSASVDNSLWSTNAARPTALTSAINAVGFATAGTSLYIRFFANKSSGSGTVNLLAYKAYWHQETVQQNGNLLQQAYAFTDGSATAINASIAVVSAKTRMTTSFSYSYGVNAGTANGQLDVFLNGQKIPRFINTSITPDTYYKEIDGQTIELDSDYSLYNYSFEVIKRIGVVDTSSTNASRISVLEAKPSGVFNYISNPDAELGLTGYNLFADAASVNPTTGAGAFTSGISLLQSTSNPLRGTYSFQISKDAANRQGQGVAYDFTIDNADKAKSLQITMDYSASANFAFASALANGDVQVWIYDKTNLQLIQPAAFTFDGNGTFNGRFQTNYNSTSYRLIFFIGSTNALAWTFNFENVRISYQQVTIGVPAIDLQPIASAAKLTITATTTAPTKGTTTTDYITWGRIGDHARIKGGYIQTAVGTAGSGDYLFQLPNNMSFDPNKVNFYTTVVGQGTDRTSSAFGTATVTNGNVVSTGYISPYDATHFRIMIGGGGASSTTCGMLSSVFYPISNATYDISFDFVAPILGWSGNVQMSSDTDTRVCAAVYNLVSGGNTAIGVPVNFDTKVIDTHGAVTTGAGAWKFTAPVSGLYQVELVAMLSTSGATDLQLFKNGSANAIVASPASSNYGSGSVITQLNANDYIDLRPDGNGAFNPNVLATVRNTISIFRLSGPSSIASTEIVAARAHLTIAQTPSSSLATYFDTIDFDTHGGISNAGNTNFRYTAPVAGIYRVTLGIDQVATTGNLQANSFLYKNGVQYSQLAGGRVGAQSIGAIVNICGSDLVKLNAGDYVFVIGNTSNQALNTGAGNGNFFCIERLKS